MTAPPPLLFLDRDGTLMEDVGYPRDPNEVRLLPGAVDGVRRLVSRGFVPVVVSNQSGLARGLITPAEAQAVHDRFVALFAAESGIMLPCFYCPHGPQDRCECRKPRPGLLRQAIAELNYPNSPGVMVGDKISDLEAAAALGFSAVWLHPVQPRDPLSFPWARAEDWFAAVAILEAWWATQRGERL